MCNAVLSRETTKRLTVSSAPIHPLEVNHQTPFVPSMACMHMQRRQLAFQKAKSTIHCRNFTYGLPTKPRSRLVSAKASGHNSSTDVGYILQQHKLLMEHGFSYDQASLILQISERRSAPYGTSAPSIEPASLAPTASPALEGHQNKVPSDQPQLKQQQQQQQQQQEPLKSLEDRLSFLEMELLKQSISPSEHLHSQYLIATDNSSTSSSSSCMSDIASSSSAAVGSRDSGLPQLDPEVLAIAETLLIRQGRVLPGPGSLQNHSTADSGMYRNGGLGWGLGYGDNVQSSMQKQYSKTPSSILGRRQALRQLRAKQMLPYGYLPDAQMVQRSSRRGLDGLGDEDDELAPYEPNGWAIASTLLLVYAGILLTFFAVVAGSAESSGIEPDVLASFWW